MGRQIIWKYYDDGYNPANTAQLTRRLVEQDKVFATVGQLGTEPVLGARAYLNQQKVPQALVSTGASYWGLQYKEFPWTIGWQPDYIAEGRLYGLHIKANFSGQEDRDRLPERRLRQGLPLRLPGGAREGVRRREHRRPGGGRDDRDVASRAQMTRDQGERRDGLRRLPAPDADGPDDRDRQGARLQPEQIYMNSVAAIKPAMDGMVAARGRAVHQRHHHDRLRQGSAGPEVEQRRRDEAVPLDHRQVRRRRERERPAGLSTASRRRRRSSRCCTRPGRTSTRASLMNALLSMNYAEQVPAPGRRPEDVAGRTTSSSARCSSSGSTRPRSSACRSASSIEGRPR